MWPLRAVIYSPSQFSAHLNISHRDEALIQAFIRESFAARPTKDARLLPQNYLVICFHFIFFDFARLESTKR